MMKTLSTLLIGWSLTACAAVSADMKEVASTFVDDRTAAVARIRLDAIADPGALGEAEPLAAAYRPWLEALRKAGARELYVVATLDDLPPDPRSSPFALVPLEGGADAKAIGALLCGGPEQGGPAAWTTCASIRGAVLAGDDATLERAKAMTPSARPDLAAALAAAGDAPVALAAATPEDLRRVIEEQVVSLPDELGGGTSSLVSRGLKWVSVTFDPGATKSIRLFVQAGSADDAAKLLAVGAKGVELMRASSAVKAFVPGLVALADSLAPRVEGDRILVELSATAAAGWVRAVIDPVAESSARRECVRNLMQIALAMHNYIDRHKSFPPSYSADAAGKPLLSWRVLILPFLEANDLYKEFHLDEPWDSPHNKALIPRMPDVFACPSTRGGPLASGTTTYKRPFGEAIGVPATKGLTIKEVTDGTSNTIMIVDAPVDQAVEWTRPVDWDVPASADAKAILARHVGGSNTAFMDGSARFLRDTIKPETLKALLTPTGGEVVGTDY
jgi:prepilin-type processing-associated H-X9-DG protein